ncbi:TRAP-type C4-dicarboxylate transport system substrate-binding protein [Humitalea rosea]|uniref:TRAP-type C4-dicarboxylate transport system substrate-binding protein n=1 Tax=Humitalea rosea TaxID=990373 RepID=A0A2W7ITF4_9PROT|nr:TRAP transporter substrate-binding protein DctP [Humitalea rosea]PZW50794.1 TRAP-type C4-dicarboxylate transport system substrate-binding protein [Humitalea rosea]
MIPRRALAGLAPALLLKSGAVRAATASWTIATEYPPTSLPGEGITAFAETVTRSGALTVLAAHSAPGGLRSAGMPAAVLDGRVAAADAFAGQLATAMPLLGLFGLPFLTASAADAWRLWTLARGQVDALLTARGLRLLYATPWPPAGLWSRRPVTTPAELAGLRLRTFDAASTATFKAAGADAQAISFADALPRLRAGDLDAVLSSGDGGAGARLWEVLPNFTPLDWAWPLSLAFCGRTALAALEEPARQAVLGAAGETEGRQWRAMDTRLEENATRMAAAGVAMQTPGPALVAVLRTAAGPVVDAWAAAAGPEGGALLAAARGR